jgi:hypothetical protein
MLYGIELRSCRVRFAFTAGMGPDTWVESNTGSRRDQLSCPNSPARRQRIVYKYPVTPPPSFFRSGSLFRIFHLFISRTAILPYCITFAICTVSPARSGPDSDGYHLSSAAGGGPLPFRVYPLSTTFNPLKLRPWKGSPQITKKSLILVMAMVIFFLSRKSWQVQRIGGRRSGRRNR